MKKNYFFAALAAALLSVGSLVAQPTLTYSNMTFPAGLTYTNVQHDTTGVTPGPAGANQTWDFSSLSQGINPVTATVHETAGSPYANTFPGSTHYTTNTGDNSLGFVSFQQSGYDVTGAYMDNAPTFTYSDPMRILEFPFTYNSSFNDTYTATYVSNGYNITRQGNINCTADGYGTLILPNGQTFNDVLRFKITDQITDMIMGTPMTSSTESYYWYKLGLPAGLLSIVSATLLGQTSTNVISLQNTTVSAPEAHSADMVKVFPNPAKGKVTIQADFAKQNTFTATLVNSLGQEVRREVYSGEAVSGNNFSLAGLSAGVYMLQLQSGQQLVTKKLIVE